MSDLKLQAMTHARIMAQGLYGNNAGAAFHAVAAREILLEAIRFIITDIKDFMDREEDPTARGIIYPKWYKGCFKHSEGVFSDNQFEQNRALSEFFKTPRVLAFDENDDLSYFYEGLESVGFNEVHSDPREFDLDRQIAKPYRDLGFDFYCSSMLDDTPLSVHSNWSQIHINGNKDRVGLTVRYGFYS